MYTLAQIQSVLFTGQYNRLYITSKYRETFVIQVLPAGEKAKQNGDVNLCLNPDAVTVFEWRKGSNKEFQNGWIYSGRWQDDFESMIADLLFKKEQREEDVKEKERIDAQKKKDRDINLLSSYNS